MRTTPEGRTGLWGKLKKTVRAHLIEPFQSSHAPVWHVARGATVGMFIALTPTVGAQMYIAGMVWVTCRFILRWRFNLAIAIAMVWISNPVTTLPIYYGFLKIGQHLLELWGHPVAHLNYHSFVETVNQLSEGDQGNWAQKLVAGLYVLLVEFGWPMLVGSMVVAIPTTIGTYPSTWWLMHRYRRRLARQAGLSYEDWKEKFVRLD